MMISNYVLVRNSKYYKNLGYGDDRYVFVNINDVSKGSKVIIKVKCDYCGNEREIKYRNYNINTKYACSMKCGALKSKETNLERYGVSCTLNSTDFKEKKRKTIMEKYGVENVFQSELVKNKIKETNLERYGVEHNMQLDLVKNKIKETNLERYGVSCPMQSNLIKNNIKKVILEKYDVKHQMESDLVKNKIKETNLERYGIQNVSQINSIIGNDINYIKYLADSISLFNCDKGHTFNISTDNYHARIKNNIPLCTVCNPIGDQKSIKEKELLEFIKFVYFGEIISSYRDVLEIDIYLPELNIGFEFNGLYYHSSKFKDKNYHLDKTNHFKEKGIRIIHIWEDDWVFKKDIVKSQIKNLLKINSKKIFARKCYVKEIKDSKIISEFLNNNHIQGKVNSSLKLGLYFEDELVSVMTFDRFEGRKKMEYGGWNLNRFCNKTVFNVIGGASKLLSYFIKNYDVKRIVSYADKDWSLGNLYEVLGFTNVGGNGPDYKYIVNEKRVHKSRYKKSKLNTTLTESKQMKLNGINKIYDCGKLKFELNI